MCSTYVSSAETLTKSMSTQPPLDVVLQEAWPVEYLHYFFQCGYHGKFAEQFPGSDIKPMQASVNGKSVKIERVCSENDFRKCLTLELKLTYNIDVLEDVKDKVRNSFMHTQLLLKETLQDWVCDTKGVLFIESKEEHNIQTGMVVAIFPDHFSVFQLHMVAGKWQWKKSGISNLLLDIFIFRNVSECNVFNFELSLPFSLSRIWGRNRLEVIETDSSLFALLQEIRKLQESPMNSMQSSSLLTCLTCGKPCQ